jgi:hypothetical protein
VRVWRRYGTETVSHDVLARMKQLMVDSSTNSASHSFLLDDDSTIPFSQDDIAAMLDDKVGLWCSWGAVRCSERAVGDGGCGMGMVCGSLLCLGDAVDSGALWVAAACLGLGLRASRPFFGGLGRPKIPTGRQFVGWTGGLAAACRAWKLVDAGSSCWPLAGPPCGPLWLIGLVALGTPPC